MTIHIKKTRHIRGQERLIVCDTLEEYKSVCCSNLTTQAIFECKLSLYGWGDWKIFTEQMAKYGHDVMMTPKI